MLTVLRRPDGLYRLVRHAAGEPQELRGSGDGSLDEAWEQLGRVAPGDAAALEAMRRVWAETTPAADGWTPPPAPRALRAPTKPQASAAHPRGYAGTIHKPPTPPTPTIDLRPFERWSSVCRALGIDEPHPLALASWGRSVLDPDALDPMVREAILVLRVLPPALVEALDHRLRRLSLPRRFLFAAADHPGALKPWLDALVLLDAGRRAIVVDALRDAGCPPADEQLPSAIARVAALGANGFEGRVSRLVTALHRGAAPSYVAGSLELELEYPSRWSGEWRVPLAGREDMAPLVREVANRLAAGPLPPESAHVPESLHRALAAVSSAAEFVRATLVAPEMDRPELEAWIHIPSLLQYEGGPPAEAAMWMADQAFGQRDRVARPHRVGFAKRITEGLFVLDSEHRQALIPLFDLARRAAPYSDAVMQVLTELAAANHEVPTAESFLAALHSTLRTRSRTPIVSNGLAALFDGAPEFAERLVHEHPKRSVRLALAIGAAHPSRVGPAVARARSEELWSSPEDLAGLARRLDAIVGLTPDLIPRAVRRALTGDATLSTAQQQGHLARVHERWDLLRASLIERSVAVEIQRGVTEGPRPLSATESHALGLLTRSGRHRRGLRRLLRDVLNGREPRLIDHPRTVRWLRTKPRLDVHRWLAGLDRTESIAGFGEVDLGFEQDLLEVLRLGDYVRTCLALGAMLETVFSRGEHGPFEALPGRFGSGGSLGRWGDELAGSWQPVWRSWGCHDDPPPQTPESAAVDDTPIGTEPGNRLQPAPDRFADGCSADADCVIESDPCGYAQAILASERDAYQEGFEGVAYDCPPVEYATDPVATCAGGRCVGHVPD